MIWVLGLDLHHFYFALALWADNVPSIKEVPENIVFYQLKPAHLEPRRPELETNDTVSNVSIGSEDENPKMIGELKVESCEFGNPVWKSDKQPVWKSEKQRVVKGKQGRKGAKKTEHCKEECNTRKVEDEKETFKDEKTFKNVKTCRNEKTCEDEKTCENEKTYEDEEKTRENENNFTNIFKNPPVPDLPPVSD